MKQKYTAYNLRIDFIFYLPPLSYESFEQRDLYNRIFFLFVYFLSEWKNIRSFSKVCIWDIYSIQGEAICFTGTNR